ncbi:hypothetical protein JK363_40250, partial [Streptomyces sp. 205]|nr:hypothetical protein [Streptomyces coffeae]
QWTQNTSGILSDFHTLCGHLKISQCVCSDGPLLHALEHFAHQPPGTQPSHGDITDNARQLIDEAAAYSYFTLTLLEIFTAPGLDRRGEQALANTRGGAPRTEHLPLQRAHPHHPHTQGMVPQR